jgi:hypothetical protein
MLFIYVLNYYDKLHVSKVGHTDRKLSTTEKSLEIIPNLQHLNPYPRDPHYHRIQPHDLG